MSGAEAFVDDGVTPEYLFQELQDLNDELKAAREDSEQFSYPQAQEKDSIFRFFWKIIGLKDSFKVANLQEGELGRMPLGVRNYLELAAYCRAEGLGEVENCFIQKSEIVSGPSMGRKGFLAKLFVTNIRREQKTQKLSTGDVSADSGGWLSKRKPPVVSDGDD